MVIIIQLPVYIELFNQLLKRNGPMEKFLTYYSLCYVIENLGSMWKTQVFKSFYFNTSERWEDMDGCKGFES